MCLNFKRAGCENRNRRDEQKRDTVQTYEIIGFYPKRSGDEEEFMPYFNYKGFQYVEVVSDKPIELTKESLTGFFMHSDVPIVGHINSSNPTLNGS